MCFDSSPSDPNIILQIQRVPVSRSSYSTSTISMPPQERSDDTLIA